MRDAVAYVFGGLLALGMVACGCAVWATAIGIVAGGFVFAAQVGVRRQ